MRQLLATGQTPWHAFRDLALLMHAERERADGPHRADGEIRTRCVWVVTHANPAGAWIAEATWDPRR